MNSLPGMSTDSDRQPVAPQKRDSVATSYIILSFMHFWGTNANVRWILLMYIYISLSAMGDSREEIE